MKVIANKTTHGRYGLKRKGDVFDIAPRHYKELHDDKIKRGLSPVVSKYSRQASGRTTKEEKETVEVKQNGSWFTVYRNGKVVDKFQGKEGLKEYVSEQDV